MSNFLVIAAVTGFISGNVLSPSDAELAGIYLDIDKVGMSNIDRSPPTLFTMSLEDFESCDVSSVWLDILDSEGHVIFGSNLSGIDNTFRYYIDAELVETSSLSIGCRTETSSPDDIYFLNLGDYVRAH